MGQRRHAPGAPPLEPLEAPSSSEVSGKGNQGEIRDSIIRGRGRDSVTNVRGRTNVSCDAVSERSPESVDEDVHMFSLMLT